MDKRKRRKHLARIAHLGGQKTFKRHGKKHMSEIGTAGARARLGKKVVDVSKEEEDDE